MTRFPAFVVFTALLTSISSNASAQTLHAVLIADTLDGSIGPGIKANLQKTNTFLRRAQNVGGITVASHEVKDNDFNCINIINSVRKLNVGSNDAVVFFYFGHGFRRNDSQTKFPEFDCRRTSDPGQAELSGVVNLLKEKKPRFVLAIADTCNVGIDSKVVIAAAPSPGRDEKAGFRKLFLNYSGTLMMSGAVPGQFSWYVNSGPAVGGFFTNQLMKAAADRISEYEGKVRWEDIATDATQPISVPTKPEPTIQTPQYAADSVREIASGN